MTYSYMKPEHAAEVEATEREVLRLERERPDLKGDALLNAATEAAGYSVTETGCERCERCGAFYHRDYEGEYVNPFGDPDLASELGVDMAVLLRLQYSHFCDIDCLRAALREQEAA